MRGQRQAQTRRRRRRREAEGEEKLRVIYKGQTHVQICLENSRLKLQRNTEESKVLMIQKQIFKSDVNHGHNRFSMSSQQVRIEFLTEEEKRKLNDQDLSMVLIQPSLESIEMNAKTKENEKLWASRTEMRKNALGFALVKIRRASAGKEGGGYMASSSSSHPQVSA
ncbi:B3 domain-containing protein At2g31720-like [Dillenia turbinata]|uniref:B3 domain-containing protein At2g31720-like n=1 Tax=Dillenia turbinata TaxID=194707 RepID=A0AAN8VLL7_9MAGN